MKTFKVLTEVDLFVRINAQVFQILKHAVGRVLTRNEFLKRYGVPDTRSDALRGSALSRRRNWTILRWWDYYGFTSSCRLPAMSAF